MAITPLKCPWSPHGCPPKALAGVKKSPYVKKYAETWPYQGYIRLNNIER